MKRKLLPAALVILIVFCSKDNNTAPEITIQERLDDALQNVFEENDGRGLSAAVVLPGNEAWRGTAYYEGTDPITPEHLFWIASITKMFTAAATLQLIDEGILNFEDQIHEFLPHYDNVDSSITVYQLLNHTSGVFDLPNHPNYSDMMKEDRSKIWTPEEIMTRMVAEPYFSPGEGWRYSTTNYIILGMIISKVTGNKVSEEFRRRFYEPLGLLNTFLDCEETITGDIANFWADFDDDDILDEVPILSVERYSETSCAYTGGGLISNAEDVARWTHALYSTREVLSQEMLDQMLDFIRDLPADYGWRGCGMGASLFRYSMVNGAYAYGHGGWGAYYLSVTAYFPDYDVTITIMLNSLNWPLWERSMAALSRVIMDYYK